MQKQTMLFVLCSLLLLWRALPGAETNGAIGGRIVDAENLQPLIGVHVLVEGTARGAATDTAGYFEITNLEPGSYNLSIRYLGYRTVLKANVIVNPKRKTILHVEMQQDLLQGREIEVSAGYFEKAKEAVVSTRTMDFEEVRSAPGAATDIQRVMQALPAVVSGTDQNNEIIIRGGIPGENLFLMDNIEIPNPNHFGEQGAGGGPINMLNTYMVRKVDFYAGAFAAKYGDKASSVMDIALRDGDRERFRGEGYMGMAGAGLLLEGPLASPKGSFILSGRKSFIDLLIGAVGLTAVPRYHSLQGKLSFDLNPRQALFLNALYGADKITTDEVGEDEDLTSEYSGDQYALGAALRTLWSKKMFSHTTLSSVRSYWDSDVYYTKTRVTAFFNRSKEAEHTFKTDFVWQLNDRVDLNWGASYKRVKFQHDVFAEPDTIFYYNPGNARPDSIFQTYLEFIDRAEASSYKTAGYAQIAGDLFGKVRLTAGARYDYFAYNDFHSWSPRLGASYFLSHNTTLNFAFGYHYQAPSYIELTLNPDNRRLKNKFTRQYVAGVEKLLRDDIKLTLEAFYKSYHDVPVLKAFTTPDPFDPHEGRLVNEASGEAKGIELFFQKKLTHGFSSILSYSYSASRAKDVRYGTFYDWDFDYRHVFTFIGGYKANLKNRAWYKNLTKKWWHPFTVWILPFGDEVEFSVKYRYLGGRPYTPPVYHPEWRAWIVEEQQALNTTRNPAYHRLDFRMDRRFIFKNWNMVVFLDMYNILNRPNIWDYQYNEDGSREEILQFQIFPVGGISFEF